MTISNLKLLLTILIIIILLILPAPTMAQTSGESSPSIFDSLGSGLSQLLTLNNPVRLDNPPNNFTLDQSPAFILITPQETALEEVTATITRKEGNKTLTALIKMIEPGKFEISLENPVKITGEYSLDVSAKESFFYTRQIIHDFNWGSDKPKEKHRSGGFMKQFIEDYPEYKDRPVFKRDRNSVHFQKPDGTIEAQISAGPVNYQDDKGQWQPIDTTLTQVGDELVGQGTPARIKLDGTVEAAGSAHSQKTTRFGWFDSATQEFTPVQDLPAGQIKEDQFIRQGDFFEHVLTLTDSGLKEELTLSDLPPDPSNLPHLMLETEVTGLDLLDGWIEKDIKMGEFTFPLPTTKDANGKEIPTKRFAKKINSIQYIYTGILASDLKSAAFPVIIDPDIIGDTADGNIYGGDNPDYATARSTYSGTASGNQLVQFGQVYNPTYKYSSWRSYIRFDTSSIGATSTVNSVYLTLTATASLRDYGVNFDCQIVKYDWSASVPLSTNSEAAYDGCLAGTADSSIWRNTSGMSLNTPYASGNLSIANVSKTSYTYYCLRSDRDVSATTPTGNEIVDVGSAENTTAAYRPILTIDYTPVNVGLQVSGMRMSGIQIK